MSAYALSDDDIMGAIIFRHVSTMELRCAEEWGDIARSLFELVREHGHSPEIILDYAPKLYDLGDDEDELPEYAAWQFLVGAARRAISQNEVLD